MRTSFFIVSLFFVLFSACGQKTNTTTNNKQSKSMENLEVITLGAGCFWCVEAVFQRIEGVEKVESGYSGGHTENPSYKEVCSETTGHAEVCQLTYDPRKVSLESILEVFFGTHDPTTRNRQGNDVGTQYRSAIFYHNETQKQTAERVIKILEAEKVFEKPIVTEITAFEKFYKAEDYHQDYYNNNTAQGYCYFVIKPKLDKLNKVFKEKLKK
ncbi:MAG: peptide-methionine (S)-S-oxide reductase MsrA [Cytophagales bacterium]|nr:peptide-methionine (S)-S-oxide reductase MsrA [Cytophagales bacterium]